MKTTLLAATAALSLVAATTAYAEGEGNGEPFPLHTPGMTFAPQAYAADTGSAPYPDLTSRPSHVLTAGGPEVLPTNGSEGAVQTANSLPRGFHEGTVAYVQAQSVRRYLAQGNNPVEYTQAARAAEAPEAVE